MGGKGGRDMRPPAFRALSRFVLTRGLILCALWLAGAAALLVRAGEGGETALRFYECAEIFRFSALTTFAAALFGSLLMEDLLRYYGE